MKRMYFRELVIMSQIEKAGRRIAFSPGKNLIIGNNGSGKSTLIKSLYFAFGAMPRTSDKWKPADATYLVRASIDGLDYTFLRNGKRYSVYDHQEEMICNCTSVTNDLSPFLAKLLDFRLLLTNRDGELIPPTPLFYFLPSYIDQDTGWSKKLNSFEMISQFAQNPSKETLYYHIGIRPNEYYNMRNLIEKLKNDLEHEQAKEKSLNSLLEGIERRLEDLDFTLDLRDYQEQVDRLLVVARELQAKESEYKHKLLELENLKYELNIQFQVTKGAANELEKDYLFATNAQPEGEIACPTCGQIHSNDFAERFSIADDSESLLKLASNISEQIDIVVDKIEIHKKNFTTTEGRLKEVKELLATKKQQIELRQILESEGRKQIRELLKSEAIEIRSLIFSIAGQIELQKKELEGLVDKKRRQEIQAKYENFIENNFSLLDLKNIPREKFSKIDWNVSLNGSEMPRGMLAYFYAIMGLMEEYGTCIQPPCVIDAPKQQELDKHEYPKVLSLIHNKSPKDRQLILSIVDHDESLDLSDYNIIDMTESEKALNSDEYDLAFQIMQPYISKTFFA